MPNKIDRLLHNLPAERRERMEAHKQALMTEYEILKALRKDLDASRLRWPP